MSEYRIGRVAELLGVSVDTVRRWADSGRLPTRRSDGGHRIVDGADLAAFVRDQSGDHAPEIVVAQSARNRFPGIVTRVVKNEVMAQVEIQAGPFRVVSLMSREACDELGLEAGRLATAAVKATNVFVDVTREA